MSKFFSPEIIYLSNGIPVIIQDYEGLVAASYWWVRTGSADEGSNEAGFAHFLEHMLFKDAAAKETGAPSIGRMARAIESYGGDINAYTSFDQTVFHVTCAEQHWERVLRVFGAMAGAKRFLKADFEREREVILEELRRNEDSPSRQLFQTLFSATFARHPYGKPVIGNAASLKRAKLHELENFYRRQYVSGNMGLVLVGPIGSRKKKLISILEQSYGSSRFPKKAARRRVRPFENPLRARSQIVARSFDVKSPSAIFAFRVPDLQHPDIPALDLLAGVLGVGETSRLYQRLFYEKALVTEASAGVYIPRDPGIFYFDVEFDQLGKTRVVAEELFSEIRRIQNEPPTLEEIDRVINRTETEKLYSTQSADELAGRLGFLQFVLGDLDFDRAYVEKLRVLEPSDLSLAAAVYFDQRRLAGAIMHPENEKIDLQSINNLARGVFSVSKTGKSTARPLKTEVRFPFDQWEQPSGTRVVYTFRPHSPLISIQAFTLGGLRLEIADPVESAERDWGASHLLGLTWTKGTPTRSSQEIARLIEGRAATLDGFSGRNSIGLASTGLARDWAELSELFADVLVNANFPEEEVEHSKRIVGDTIRGIEDHTGQLCNKYFLDTLFDTHPYGRFPYGSLESVAENSREKLLAYHRRWLRPERLVLSVSGNLRKHALTRWLNELEAQMNRRINDHKKGSSTSKGLREIILADESPLKAPRWVESELNRGQYHIIVGGLGTQVNSAERFVLRLMQTLLGGQSGRLFVELREKKSLAYSVAPLSFEGLEKGYLGTYIACSPDKKTEAIQGIQAVLERLAEKGPTPGEMKRAKEFYLGKRAMELQGDAALAEYHGLQILYGLGTPSWVSVRDEISGISADQVRRFCEKYLVNSPMVTAVVG